MDYKKSETPASIETLDVHKMADGAENIYQAVIAVSKRANQISVDIKQELSQKLEEFASYTDNLEEIFDNREQIEISRYYERLPKSTLLAVEEYLSDELYFRKPEEDAPVDESAQ
ncbi:MAG TPA: DNA-directed RNA polymerase subunit omega [Bacteroidales bacterium]|nr:DNA-directed RNA polymerase subunit omega [Bacteroidales bacterium]